MAMRILLTFSILLILPTLAFSAALDLQQDAEGWTIFTPSSDTRVMYVSATGNNTTGTVYTSANHPDWTHPQSPSGTINSFASFAAAYANVRQGYPDWVLFKRGDTFYDQLVVMKSGRSVSEPLFVGAYGSSGLSPLLKLPDGTADGISLVPTSAYAYSQQYVGVQGIRFYSYTRNPDDPGYSKNTGADGIDIYGRYMNNILIEGCGFSYGNNNRVSGIAGYGLATDITFRRNLFTNNYSEESHSMGLGAGYTENFLLEENIFDHNGWLIKSNDGDAYNKTDGQACAHNHSTYFSGDKNSIFRGNISLRPSSIHFKHAISAGPVSVENLLHDNNLLVDGEIGFDVAGNGPDLGVGIKSYTASNNIFYKIGLSDMTERGVSWAMAPANVGAEGANIYSNFVLNKDLPTTIGDVGLVLGIDAAGTYTTLNNTSVHDNVFMSGPGAGFALWVKKTGVGSTIQNNYFEVQDNNYKMLYSELPEGEATAYSFIGNQYFKASGGKLYKTSSTTEIDHTQWQTLFEPTATFTEMEFPDETRSVETYMASIGETATIDAFIEKCRSQDRYNWDTRFTAPVVNAWIKKGFNWSLWNRHSLGQGLMIQ